MNDRIIDSSACIQNSKIEENVKFFRNVRIRDSILLGGCSVGDDTTIERCNLENNIVVNRRSYINDSYIGRYTYMGINTTINWTRIGRFCSIARNVDIGGFDHDYRKISMMPSFRMNQMLKGGGKIPKQEIHDKYCEIGSDVWIAAGAQILHDVKIGHGAVVGAGAVVTRDVLPYTIVAGVPAKVIGYRCEEKYIEELLNLAWWDWDEGLIKEIFPQLIDCNIDDQSIEWLKSYRAVAE